MKKHFLLLSLLSWIVCPAHTANDIYFSKIGIEQGLSQLSVTTIYQDELGRMWFGTRQGVNLYTGKRMHTFLSDQDDPHSLQSNLISGIAGDGKGSVYILSHKGINKFDIATSKMTLLERGSFDAIAYAKGKLWAVAQKSVFAFENNSKTLFFELPEASSNIRRISIASTGDIYLGTANSVYKLSKNKKAHQVLTDCSTVAGIYEDSKKSVWIPTWENGLFRIDREGKVINYTHTAGSANTISSNFVRAVCEDNSGDIWVGTKKGLDKLNTATHQFTHYSRDSYGYQRLSNQSVWALYKDKQGTIWVGTYYGGANYFNPETNFFAFHDLHRGTFINRPFPIISDIKDAPNGNLYLCTEGDGLIEYNPVQQTYITYQHIENNPRSLSGDNIKVAYLDKEKQQLWLGMHLGGLNLFDMKTKQITRYENIKPEWEQTNIVRAIVPYGDKLLVATYNGLFVFDPITGKFSLFSEQLHRVVKYFVDVKSDKNGNLWIAGNNLIKYNIPSGKYVRYNHIRTDRHSISDNNPTKILIDSHNRIWVATDGKGLNLYDQENDKFIRYNSSNTNLTDNFISNIKESKLGYIVITTSKGFFMLDPETENIYQYGPKNGIPINSFYNGGMELTESGELYLAGMNGMVSLFEERLMETPKEMKIRLMALWLNNKPVQPLDDTGVLHQALPFVRELHLSYKHSMITFEFAIDNFIPSQQQNYRYRLSGLSNVWTELPSDMPRLNFMQLNPGKYKLELQAFSPLDGKVNAETSLDIRVAPPCYRSWPAYLLYLLLLSLIVWRILKFNRAQLLLKTSLEYEKKEKQNIEAVNQSKLRFFTNISHEFRTPLTLIAGQVDMLMQSNNVPPAIYNRILSIKRNTQSMQGLITELLEFRKSEQGHLTIKAVEHDLIYFLYEIFLSFQEHAKYRQIGFFFDCKIEKINLWFDPVQMQKVFYNLISNAFKYTPQHGVIRIVVEDRPDHTIVEVVDSGVGIQPEEAEKIFDRFYQAEKGLAINSMTPGTGIGLALTKNILEAHGATISVSSEQNAGTRFIVRLKKGAAHFTNEQKGNPKSSVDLYQTQIAELDNEFISEMTADNGHKEQPFAMLIVEDNEELAQLLKQIFEPIYRIHLASDGQEGLDKTIELMPDIVLSDLMMPNMSGAEMCSAIKNNFMTSHIPVVLLTAQTAIEYNIEGLRLGADDYVTKPFNVRALITRCNNLVNGRKMLQQKFSKQSEYSPHLIATNRLDQEFMEKAQRIIEENLDNADFDVEAFSAELALGRTKLFGKIKGITGQTPNEFIINVRMKKASSLLIEHPRHTISEIAYMVGFNTPKYFAKCFKDQFGVTPSEYRKGKE